MKNKNASRPFRAALEGGPWNVHLQRYRGRYACVLAAVLGALPLSLVLVILVAYAFNQLQNPAQALAWMDLVGEHASRWLKPWVRGTGLEDGIPVEFQRDFFAPALIFIAIILGSLKFAQEYLLEDIGEKVAADLRHAVTAAYSELPYERAAEVEGALLASVVGEDAREVRQTFTRLWGSIPADGLACVLYATFLALLDTQLFALLIAILLPAGVVIRITGKSLKRLARQGLRSQSELLEALLEKMRGWQTIQVLGGVPRELRSFNVTNDRLYTVWRRSARAKALASPLVEWLGVLAGAFVIVLALRRIAEGALSSSVLTAFLVTIGQLANAGQSLSTQLQSARKGTEALRRAQALVYAWVGAERGRNLLSGSAREKRMALDDSARKAGPLRIVTLQTCGLAVARPCRTHAPAETTADRREPQPMPPLAADINVALVKGDFLAVIGPSGAGKSTFLRVLLGLEPPAAGSVILNGAQASESAWLRASADLAFLPQEPFLVAGTVLENVVYPAKVDTTDSTLFPRVAEALAKANLAHKDAGERVFGLSGGERQRLMFARAFFRNATLWIIDEATSALDTQNESAILTRLREDASRRIVVAVAHRESVKAFASRRLDLGAKSEGAT